VTYSGVLTAELRDASEGTHDAIRRLVEQCGGEVLSIGGTTLKAQPGPAVFAGEHLMRHVQADPAVIPESVGWG
jgi:hypothetical protein